MPPNNIDVEQLREDLLAQLRNEHPTMCRRWFENIEVLGIVDGSVFIYLQELVQLNYLERCCKSQFVEAAQFITGHLFSLSFLLAKDCL